jgi:uncharacterized membrane protein YecN with MAPEG domain
MRCYEWPPPLAASAIAEAPEFFAIILPAACRRQIAVPKKLKRQYQILSRTGQALEYPEMPLTPPIISAFTAGILIIMQMALLIGVIAARRRNRQSLGDGGHKELLAAIRRHGNLAENAPIFVAGFTLFELLGGDKITLAVLCAAFILGRISHIIGLSMKNTVNRFRVAGTTATVIVGVALGIRLVLVAASRLPL